MLYLGDFAAGSTIYIPFHTFNSSGASVTITGLAVTDVEIYKSGSVTQRASDAGYTLLDTDGIDFDGVTGIHGFSVNTGDNTDAGFYAAGADYWVVVSAITVDGQTVNFVAAIFSIDNRGLLRPTTAGRTLDVAATGEAGLDLGNALVPVGAIPWLGIIDNGVAQAAAGTAVTIRAAASFAADDLIGMTYASGNNSRIISDNDASDGVTVASAFTSDPGAAQYYIFGSPPGSNFEAGLADGAITAAKIGSDAFTAAKFAADVTTEFQNGLATAAALATVDGNVDAILLDTAEIGTAGAGLTNINLPNQTMDIVGNITGNLSGSVGSVTGAVGSVTGAVGSVTGAVGSVTGNVDGNVTGTIGGLATQAKADVNAEVGTALSDIHLDHLFATDYDPASKPGTATALLNELVENNAGVSRFTAGALAQAPTGGGETLDAIADAVWDELLSGHAVSGSTGEALSAAAAGGGLDEAGVRDALGLAAPNLDTQLGAIKSDTAATLVDTAEIGAAGAGLTVLATQATAAAILEDTGTTLPAQVAALNNLSADDVLDEVVEGSTTLRESIRLANSALGGKASGLGTSTATFRDLADTKDRVTATVDSDGNRSNVVRDLT
jgi:hypothetical protein